MSPARLIAFTIVLFLTGNRAGAVPSDSLQSYRYGRSLFQTHCSSCHGVHREIAGPMLASIEKKQPEAWLLKFIRNSQGVIAGGDTYAQHLYRQFNHQVMPSFTDLSDADVRSILRYLARASRRRTDETALFHDVLQRSDATVLHGSELFQDQCATCHAVSYETNYAPCLGSVTKRKPSVWLLSFIGNSSQVIHSGDPYATYLFERFDRREMPQMKFLSHRDIADILAYIEFVSASSPAEAGANGRKKSTPSRFPVVDDALSHPGHTLVPVKILLIVIVTVAVFIYSYIIARLFLYVKKEVPDPVP